MTTDPSIAAADRAFMAVALRLARRGTGRTADNPSVGCVLVRDGRIVARARTSDGGRPHAEANALALAGEAARGATAYVTLEPCAHWGRTPPCSKALIEAGIARVVVAVEDPDPRVDGGGLAMLRAAGIEVVTGVETAAAESVLAGYLKRRRTGRPAVTLKLAASLDGRIATATGASRWITGPEARARGHLMRARHDAILIGAGTAAADDPELTCRLPGLEAQSPVRVVLDSNLSLSPTSRLMATAGQVPTWLVCRGDVPDRRQADCSRFGATVLPVAGDGEGRPAVDAVLAVLAGGGINSVLVEGGAAVAAAFLRADAVDILALFRAPVAIGGDGRAALDGLGVTDLAGAPRFRSHGIECLGADTLETLRRAT
ncbi:bifunctional diaminohydroxyphosphoribosylaminopyrimidine deaminase/5-amino-6-(5-phosphoribosylamino)uracil reductase RibD [Thalassobaculum sp. OXR-137]|uniref:bifunctional diaminohydroxyphosphoribosylaminopyrimidine deaminase/5-amino-6-(5-phosphoribosylamino)uracil reductase RibD n=1 Tax=Thalassobaculum sp. OXR-137 TaxID=3100173 RepID=UPI002AC8D2F4|nr:bifunctional diaminohydroxyphosphoribosylaminopyrimidine deaminase/5-amino-6-(5-phosphoribosylamino)uracil reductase RibD [Thalassobaculum sp. OXR-137]WPZ33277.1 bifunctional diaminohydroxyphosphoribosylaminopyrimidine deaminase/5-amino-6-(5-phosphoribosylamino)uracil reductase RibD [Thalassobaculum sp. OXR-137]